MILNINPNWTFKEAVSKIQAIKLQYDGVLSSFSYFDIKKKRLYIKEVKNSIYSFHFEVWKMDRLWDYMNDNIEFEVFDKIV